MPSKKKKYNARFPAGRIKKIMQSDEEVGKVAQAVPIIISRTLELFVESLLNKTLKITNARCAKTLSPSHMKQCIMSENRFDFLRELVKNVPDINVAEEQATFDSNASSPQHSLADVSPEDSSTVSSPGKLSSVALGLALSAAAAAVAQSTSTAATSTKSHRLAGNSFNGNSNNILMSSSSANSTPSSSPLIKNGNKRNFQFLNAAPNSKPLAHQQMIQKQHSLDQSMNLSTKPNDVSFSSHTAAAPNYYKEITQQDSSVIQYSPKVTADEQALNLEYVRPPKLSRIDSAPANLSYSMNELSSPSASAAAKPIINFDFSKSILAPPSPAPLNRLKPPIPSLISIVPTSSTSAKNSPLPSYQSHVSSTSTFPYPSTSKDFIEPTLSMATIDLSASSPIIKIDYSNLLTASKSMPSTSAATITPAVTPTTPIINIDLSNNFNFTAGPPVLSSAAMKSMSSLDMDEDYDDI